jgi:hypothetical protein
MRVFRTILVLTGATVFLPSPPDSPQTAPADGLQETVAVVSAASQTVSDMASFCSRQPGVCETAGYVASRLEAKAKYSVRLLYEWASEANEGPQVSPYADQAAADPITTGSMALATAAGSQSTLRLEDLAPAWRGPVLAKKG